MKVTFNEKKVGPKQFSIATLPLPSLFLSKVFNTVILMDKLTNSSENVQVKIVEKEKNKLWLLSVSFTKQRYIL